MKFLLILLSLLPLAHASAPELFGASASTIATGNQAVKNSAANNYYAAALLGFSKSTQFSFDLFYIDTAFKPINNVVIKNETNTVNSSERGDIKINPVPTTMVAVHFSTPLFAPEGPKFNFSFTSPVDRLMETDSGDPYAPRYVMYASRYLRPTLLFSLAQSFSDWSYSAGVHTGIQSSGEAFFVTRTTAGNPSTGKLGYNAKPSIGAVISLAKKTNNHTSYLNFQQEMKSRFKSRAVSETEIASSAAFQFDLDLTSLLYYDPTTIRAGHQVDFEDSQLYVSLDYQIWRNFESSTLEIKKSGGSINSSNDYEKLKLRDIFIPKIGYEKNLSEKWKGKVGYFYRESPLKTNNLKNAGNSIDVSKHVASLGVSHLISFYGKDITWDVAYQAHLLRSQKIKKTPNLEDDQNAGTKIGGPGYDVGGMIHVVSMGLSWMY